MEFLRKLLNKILPEDNEPGCGYGILKLPSDHPFTRACNLHDADFELAHANKAEKTLAEADFELFYRWTLIARAQPTAELRCKYAQQICALWPLAHHVGPLLWDEDIVQDLKAGK